MGREYDVEVLFVGERASELFCVLRSVVNFCVFPMRKRFVTYVTFLPQQYLWAHSPPHPVRYCSSQSSQLGETVADIFLPVSSIVPSGTVEAR